MFSCVQIACNAKLRKKQHAGQTFIKKKSHKQANACFTPNSQGNKAKRRRCSNGLWQSRDVTAPRNKHRPSDLLLLRTNRKRCRTAGTTDKGTCWSDWKNSRCNPTGVCVDQTQDCHYNRRGVYVEQVQDCQYNRPGSVLSECITASRTKHGFVLNRCTAASTTGKLLCWAGVSSGW